MTGSQIWQKLYDGIGNEFGVAGILGNLYVESKMIANNLQNSYNTKLGMTDEEYTKAVDDGTYKDFVGDGAGYGLPQVTAASRKKSLLEFSQKSGKSIGDCEMQLEYILEDLKRYTGLLNTLMTCTDVKTASTQFCCLYERPASLSNPVTAATTKLVRARWALKFYNTYRSGVEDMSNKVKLGSASLGSNGKAKGDKIGDQGNEVRVCDWYRAKLGWVLIRPKDKAAARVVADSMKAMCENQNFGYNQNYHDRGYDILKAADALSLEGIKNFKGKCDTDCSGSVRICLAAAGIFVPTFRTKNAVQILGATGKFDILTDAKYTTMPDYLRKGDILNTRTSGHVVIVLNDGAKAEKTANYKTVQSQGILYKDQSCTDELSIVYAGTVVEDFGVTPDGKLHGIKVAGYKGYINSVCLGWITKQDAIVYAKPGMHQIAVVPKGEQVEYCGQSQSKPEYIGAKYGAVKGYIHKDSFV